MKIENNPPIPKDVICMSAVLQDAKIFHEVIDPTFSNLENLGKTDFSKYKHIAVYSDAPGYSSAKRLVSVIRSDESNKAVNIIVWGKDLKSKTEELIGAGADMVILEHPFQSLPDLINTLNTPFNPFLDGVPDIAFKNYFGKVFFTEARKDKIHSDYIIPAYDRIDLKKYASTWNKDHKGIYYPVQIDRTISPFNLVKEIELVERSVKPKLFNFLDWQFSSDPVWLNSFGSELQKKNVSISFQCCCKADDLNDGVLQQLKASGCKKLWIVANGNEHTLEGLIVKSKNLGIKTGLVIEADDEIPYEKIIEAIFKARPDLVAVAKIQETMPAGVFDQLLSGSSGPGEKAGFYKNVKEYIIHESKIKFIPKWKKRLNPALWISISKAAAAKNKLGIKQPVHDEQV